MDILRIVQAEAAVRQVPGLLGIAHVPERGPEAENLGLGDLDHGGIQPQSERGVKEKRTCLEIIW